MAEAPANPYVGPRPLQESDPLHGRDRELHDVFNLLLAARVVLLVSPSGAGKTSLIRAGLVDLLRRRRFHVLPVLRVGLELPDALLAAASDPNPFLLSVQLCLEHDDLDDGAARPQVSATPERLAQIARTDLATRIDELCGARPSSVLIFDQFEEVLTLDTGAARHRDGFFRALGELLAGNTGLWALFAMREEHLAALAAHADPIPTHFSTIYRLGLLGPEAAAEAIEEPAVACGVTFERDEDGPVAVAKLVHDLSTIQVRRQGTTTSVTGSAIEPVQLQVVCRRMWQRLPPGTTTITVEHLVSMGGIDSALEDFLTDAIDHAARASAASAWSIRQWLEQHLITEGIRSQVLADSNATRKLDLRAIDTLREHHVLRREMRNSNAWYELAHDRLIDPLRRSNRRIEAERQQAELARQQAEAARQQAEAERQQAEAARQQAEAARRRRAALIVGATIVGVGLLITGVVALILRGSLASKQSDLEETEKQVTARQAEVDADQARVIEEKNAVDQTRTKLATRDQELDAQLWAFWTPQLRAIAARGETGVADGATQATLREGLRALRTTLDGEAPGPIAGCLGDQADDPKCAELDASLGAVAQALLAAAQRRQAPLDPRGAPSEESFSSARGAASARLELTAAVQPGATPSYYLYARSCQPVSQERPAVKDGKPALRMAGVVRLDREPHAVGVDATGTLAAVLASDGPRDAVRLYTIGNLWPSVFTTQHFSLVAAGERAGIAPPGLDDSSLVLAPIVAGDARRVVVGSTTTGYTLLEFKPAPAERRLTPIDLGEGVVIAGEVADDALLLLHHDNFTGTRLRKFAVDDLLGRPAVLDALIRLAAPPAKYDGFFHNRPAVKRPTVQQVPVCVPLGDENPDASFVPTTVEWEDARTVDAFKKGDILLSTLKKSFFADTPDGSCARTVGDKLVEGQKLGADGPVLDGPRVGWLEDSEYVPKSRRGPRSVGHGTWKWVHVQEPGSCACEATRCRE